MKVVLASLLFSGCYLAHEAPIDEACESPEGDFIRDDCSFCNAYHYSWLSVCGDQIYVTSTSGVHAVFDVSECGDVELVACNVREDSCVAPEDCDGLDVSTFDELLAVRTALSPRGGETTFQPYTGEEPFGEAPSCSEVIRTAPTCD